MSAMHNQRFVVVGTSGSGKTSFAARLAAVRAVPHIELDALHWEPNWTEAPDDVFHERVDAATSAPGWVVDGNYKAERPFIWQRADAVVWLDYQFHLVMWRLLTRTICRSACNQELWKGNRESFRMSFLSKDSVVLWGLTTYHRRRREYTELLAQGDFPHLTVYHFKTPAAAEKFLVALAAESGGTKKNRLS